MTDEQKAQKMADESNLKMTSEAIWYHEYLLSEPKPKTKKEIKRLKRIIKLMKMANKIQSQESTKGFKKAWKKAFAKQNLGELIREGMKRAGNEN